MAEGEHPGEALARAAAYPYEAPRRSFVQTGERSRDLGAGELELEGRGALLTYGSNAAPAVLARKLAALPQEPLPLVRAELADLDVVYSAHISAYGAVPATLQRSPGARAPVFVAYPTPEQLRLLTATEPNYELRLLGGLELRPELGSPPAEVHAYLSRHGCLALAGSEVALAAVEAAGRRLPAMGEIEVLDQVRHLLAPELDLERFVESSLDPARAVARTAALHDHSRPFTP